jgi:hypothetical protein
LPVLLSGLAVGLVDFCGDLVGVFLGDADEDALGDGVEVPPGAVQLSPLGDEVTGGLDGGTVVGPVVAGSDVGAWVGLDTPVLGLTGGLDAASDDEVAGLDDVSGVEVTGGLLVFGVVSCDAAGVLVATRQVALGEAARLDVVPAPTAL